MRYVLPIVILTAIFATGLEAQVSPDEVTRPDEVNRNDSPPRSGVAPRVAPRVAVVLSGGGARGAAHIGVLRELEKAGVPIDLIVGTSFGAFVGGLYAVGYSTADIELIVQSMDWTHLLSNKMDRRLVDFSNKYRNDRQFELEMDEWNLKLPTGLQSGPRIQQLLDRLTAQVVLDANNDFDKLAVPFRAVATDILTGEPYLFKSGSLSTAIRSSIAIPGLLTPVEFENTLLIDGGVADILPIDLALAEGADVVIAVDVSKPLKNQKEQIESLVDILNQVAGFYAEQRKQANLKNPAIVITPVLGEMGLVDFDQSSLAIQRGVAAADQALPDISRQLEAKGIQRNSPRPRVSLLDPTNLDLDHVTLSNKTIVPSEIHVEGLQRYPESYVLGYVSSQPGLPSSSTTLDHDISALYATGLFDAARYQLWKDERGTQLAYNLHERAPLQIGLGLRYDREYKFTSLIDMVGRDVVAIGSDLSLRVIAGGAESVEFGVNRKRIFGTNLIFSPQIHFRSQGRLIRESGEALGDYQDRRFGVQGSLQYFPGNLARVELAYQWDHVDIDRGVSRFIEPAARNLAGLKAGVRFDNLNNVDFPTGGTLGTLEFQWRSRNLGSDLTFSRSIVDLDHYFSSPFGTTIGLTANLGVVHGTAPFYESFFTGGAQDLSFASTRFPGLTRDEILSKRVGIVGMSFRRPIHHFQAGIFDDVYLNAEYKAGFFSRGSLDTWRSSNPLHGFGIGLYFDVHLLGPMLLELGKTDRTGLQPYFSIGHSF